MKKISSFFIVFLMVLGLSGIATAYTIQDTFTDVGELDAFVSKKHLENSGDSTEFDWVSEYAPDISYSYKIEENSFNWVETNTSGIWAHHFLGESPGYFLIKTGGSNNTHYLFENLNSKSYAVINLGIFDAPGSSTNFDISGISHITAFGVSTTTTTIHQPEPTTFLLLGFGLLGVAGVSRKNYCKSI